MNILAIDQARNGGWSVFNYETKEVVKYGSFSFPYTTYDFEDILLPISKLVVDLVEEYDVAVVYIEDVQYQPQFGARTLIQLARLQGALIALFKYKEYPFGIVTPSQWQGFCGARSRVAKEKKEKLVKAPTTKSGKRPPKVFSIEFVKDVLGIETDNDNLADACCIGYYVVNHEKINILNE